MGGHFRLTFNSYNNRRLLKFWRGQKVQTALAEVSIMHRVFIGSQAGGANPKEERRLGVKYLDICCGPRVQKVETIGL